MNKVLFLLMIVIPVFCYSQDTAILFFRNRNVLISKEEIKVENTLNDSDCLEEIFKIGFDKFLYLKWHITDSLPVEMGQLGLYTIRNKLYLLREGMWMFQNNKQNILFENNSGSTGMPEEFSVSREPSWFESDINKRAKRRRIRKTNL